MSRSSCQGTETSPIAGTAPPTGTSGTEEFTGPTAVRPVGKENQGKEKRTTGSPAREPGRTDPETTFPKIRRVTKSKL